MKSQDIVIVAAKRTPMGSLQGALSSLAAPELGAASHKACLNSLDLKHLRLDEVLMGCVLAAGIGQAPARQSAHLAQLSESIPAYTINKMCGSGMKAVMNAYDSLMLGRSHLILAGGMESMSQAPYLLKKARGGYRLGHGTLLDHMFLDGLEDAYEPGRLMGSFADETAQHFKISRAAQDSYAKTSMERALHAQSSGEWHDEITPITLTGPKNTSVVISKDEHPQIEKLAKIPHLKPAFNTNGTVTPANSSAISDGAASLILSTRSFAEQHHLPILGRIAGHSSFAQSPKWFTTAPVYAIQKLLKELKWQPNTIDLYEINEAFAVVPLVAMQELDIPHAILNIQGGACALGHPIGASGARIIVTLLHALRRKGAKRGVAAICIGGGEATAIGIEVV